MRKNENYFEYIQKDIGSRQNYPLFRDHLNKKRKCFSLNSVINEEVLKNEQNYGKNTSFDLHVY